MSEDKKEIPLCGSAFIRINKERDRIREKLVELKEGEVYDQLYAAQQALIWSLNTEVAKSPFDMIMKVGVGSEQSIMPVDAEEVK